MNGEHEGPPSRRPDASESDVTAAAEAILFDCLGSGVNPIAKLCELTDQDGRSARQAARWVQLLDEVGFLLEPVPEEDEVPGLGPYRVLTRLGSGGMGTVYLAQHEDGSAEVALKVLHPEVAASATSAARLQREALVATRIDHPSICTVQGFGREGNLDFLVMPYVPGCSLREAIGVSRQAGRTPVTLPSSDHGTPSQTLWHYFERIAHALHVAHEAGLVHRDVKPANLMVMPSGDPVLLDFGLALADGETTLTRTGDRPGTPAYMSPEQVSGTRADRRSDVYSLGVVLFECTTGELPYRAIDRESLFRQILRGELPDARRRFPHVSREAWTVMQTAMAREPERRYATASDFAEDLRRLRLGLPVLARSAGPLLRGRRFVKRHPLAAALIAGSTSIALLFAAGLWQRDQMLESLRSVESALRASSGDHGPTLSLIEAVNGYRGHQNPETCAALYSASSRCRETVRIEHDALPCSVIDVDLHLDRVGDRLLTVHYDGAARLWTLDGELAAVLRHGTNQIVNSAVFGPDGRMATASMDGRAIVWDRSGDPLAELPHGAPARDPERDWIDPARANCVLWADWSPDGSTFATGCSDHRIRFWDVGVEPPQLVGDLAGHAGPPLAHAWSQDGALLATAEGDAFVYIGLTTARVLVHRTSKPHLRVATLAHPGAIHALAFAADGRTLVTGCNDGHIRIFDLPSDSGLHSDINLEPESTVDLGGCITAVSCSSRGDRILASSTNGVVAMLRLDGSLAARHVFDSEAWMRFFAGDRILGHAAGNLILHLDDELRIEQEFAGHGRRIVALAATPDGAHLVSSSQDLTTRVWRISDKSMPRLVDHSAPIFHLAVLGDGKLVSASDDGTVKLRDDTGRCLEEWPIRRRPWLGGTMDGAARRLAMTALDSKVEVLDLIDGDLHGPFVPPGPRGRGAGVAWLADDRLAVGGVGGTEIAIHDLLGGSVTHWFKQTPGMIKVLAACPARGALVGAGWNGRIAVWRRDGTLCGELETEEATWIEALSASADGSLLAAGGDGHVVSVWQWHGEDMPAAPSMRILRGHEATITSLAWSQNGRLLASGDAAGTVRLWRTTDFSLLTVLRGHDRGRLQNRVRAMAFSRDGSLLWTGGDDGSIRGWPTDPEEMFRIALDRAPVKLGTPSVRRYAELSIAGDPRATEVGKRIHRTALRQRDAPQLYRLAQRILDDASMGVRRDLSLGAKAIAAALTLVEEPPPDWQETARRIAAAGR